MQWFKSFYDKNHSGDADYDPVARRQAGKGAAAFGRESGDNRRPAGGGRGAPRKSARPGASDKPAAAAAGAAAGAAAPAARRAPRATAASRASGSGGGSGAGGAAARRAEQLEAQVADLKLSVEGLERERDFYFGKLRDIEILLQSQKDTKDEALVKQVFTILYATEEDFVVVDEETPESDGAADTGAAAPAGTGAPAVAEDKENHASAE